MGNIVLRDLIGKVFHRLTVVSYYGRIKKHHKWNCLCSCGNQSIVAESNLLSGVTRSCGCLRGWNGIETLKVHGELSGGKKESKEYRCWVNVRMRCLNPNNASYHRYGGRGIKVCDRWLESFENFLLDMGRAPSSKHSIERIENEGNYEPGNCRWATQKEQQNNRSSNRILKFQDKEMTVSQWAQYTGVRRSLIFSRLNMGWSVDESLFKPS